MLISQKIHVEKQIYYGCTFVQRNNKISSVPSRLFENKLYEQHRKDKTRKGTQQEYDINVKSMRG